jgi:hypothetical protein
LVPHEVDDQDDEGSQPPDDNQLIAIAHPLLVSKVLFLDLKTEILVEGGVVHGLLGRNLTNTPRNGYRKSAADADRWIDGNGRLLPKRANASSSFRRRAAVTRTRCTAALATDAAHVASVGSRRKAQALKAALAARGVDERRLAALRCPAGPISLDPCRNHRLPVRPRPQKPGRTEGSLGV